MLKNYFNTALRNFRANKYFSLANIAGLSIGISASLVISHLIYYDFSFDKFEKGGDRIYRVVGDFRQMLSDQSASFRDLSTSGMQPHFPMNEFQISDK